VPIGHVSSVLENTGRISVNQSTVRTRLLQTAR